MASDPCEFTQVEYQGTRLNDSIIELFQESSLDEDFKDFQDEDAHFGIKSRVKTFHHQRNDER